MSRGGLILLVDDEREIRESLTLVLEVDGYTVRTAPHGARGLELLQVAPYPELILLDLMMPIMDGHEFLEAKARLELPLSDTPVVVLTASHQPSVPNARAVLKKPFDIDELLETIELHRRR